MWEKIYFIQSFVNRVPETLTMRIHYEYSGDYEMASPTGQPHSMELRGNVLVQPYGIL